MIELIKNLLRQKINEKTKVIVLHGSSSSGKSTFAKNLKEAVKNTFKTLIISIDSFYISKGSVKNYDFDNPSAIDWVNVCLFLKAIHDKKSHLPYFSYNFKTQQSNGPIMKENTFPELIIIEGIYAINCFSPECFDVCGFDPYNPSKERWQENSNKFPNFCVLTIKLAHCFQKMKSIRVERDILSRGRTEEFAIRQFEEQVWPASKKWINNSHFVADIVLIHGTFNSCGYKTLFSALTEFLTGSSKFINHLEETIQSEPCSEDCADLGNEKVSLVLRDK